MGDVTYKWHDSKKHYYLWKNGDFIKPLQPLKLSKLNKGDIADTLQNIYYKRTGEINWSIGLDHKKDVALAKEMDCWD